MLGHIKKESNGNWKWSQEINEKAGILNKMPALD
jgi:hypothetical protein